MLSDNLEKVQGFYLNGQNLLSNLCIFVFKWPVRSLRKSIHSIGMCYVVEIEYFTTTKSVKGKCHLMNF